MGIGGQSSVLENAQIFTNKRQERGKKNKE